MEAIDPTIVQLMLALSSTEGETIAFVFLDEGGSTLGVHHVPASRRSSILVPMRALVVTALVLDAALVVMAHNHPSGDPEPSAEDLRTTRRIAGVLDSLGIRLVDHLVLAGGSTVSFRARGLL